MQTDTTRLDWVLDILSLGEDDAKADSKTLKIMGAIMLGKTGRDAIDAAMENSGDPEPRK